MASGDGQLSRVFTPEILLHRDLSQIIDPLSADDQQALRPVLQRQNDLDVQYSISDINVLRSIVQLAIRSEHNTNGNNFITIFKSYETVLQRRKVDTSKDTFYFKLVVKLCRSEGHTWAEKYNNLLREINASLVARRKPQLKARYRQFLQYILRNRLNNWRKRALVHKARSVALRRAAIKYDKSSLASQAFEIWRTKLRVSLEREQLLREYVIRSDLKAILSHWRSQAGRRVAAREQAVGRFVKHAKFMKWRRQCKKLRDLRNMALAFEQERRIQLLRDSIKMWFHKTCLVQAHKFYTTTLLYKCMDSWVAALEKIDNLADRADMFRRKILLRTVIAVWQNRTVDLLEVQDLANAFGRRVLLRRAWIEWTRAKTLRRVENEVVLTNDISCASQYLNIWRSRANNVFLADTHYRAVLISRHLKRMREQLRLHIVLRRRQQRAKHKAVYTWVLKERSNLLSRVNTRRLVFRAFTAWRAVTVKRKTRDGKTVNMLYGAINYRLALNTLSVWRRKASIIRQMNINAMDIKKLRLKRHFYDIMKSKLRHSLELQTLADSHFRTGVLKVYIGTWRSRLKSKLHDRREKMLESLLLSKRDRARRKIFDFWMERTIEKLDLVLLADDFFEQSSRKLMASVLQMWRNRVDTFIQFEDTADAFSRRHTIVRVFNVWRQRKLYLDDARHRAMVVYDINSLLRAQNIIRRWNMRALQIGILVAKADVFAEKHQHNRTRDIFGKWVDVTRERKQLEESNNQPFTESDDEQSDSGTIKGESSSNALNDDLLTYTPTKRRLGTRVAFVAPRIDMATPKVERWARLRNSPMYEGRRKLFVTPMTRREKDEGGGRTI